MILLTLAGHIQMPAKLTDECSKYTCRLPTADMDYLAILFPNNRDAVLRALVTRYVDTLRSRQNGSKA